MRHSIIIPNRNRDEPLRLCCEALRRSAAHCGETDWEIVVGTDNPTLPVLPVLHVVVVRHDGPFNKPRLLNAALTHATGETITVLDADAIVPKDFFTNLAFLEGITKLCYRVRRLDIPATQALLTANSPDFDAAFARWDEFTIAYEGYRFPHISMPERPRPPVFGNSQFSIRRETLGDLRYDEEYAGRGHEDVDFNLQIWQRHFDTYNATILKNQSGGLLHVANPDTVKEDWGVGNYNNLNNRRYGRKFGLWRRELKQKGIML